jgi:hypothetical protein
MMPRLFYILLLVVLAASANASMIAEYPRFGGPATYTPEFEFWDPIGFGLPAQSTEEAVTIGSVAAWRIGDRLTTDSVLPRYRVNPVGNSAAELVTYGWSFKTTARLENDFGAGPAQGLGAYFGDRAYWATVDRTPAGVLQLYLSTSAIGGVQTIANLATGAAASQFFDLEMRYTPGNNNVAVLWNGAQVSQWIGIPTTANHPQLFQFGSQLTTGAGAMDFKYVALRSLDPTFKGDYNGDAAINTADYSVWRENFGSYSNLAADGNANLIVDAGDFTYWRDRRSAAATAIPEPATILLLVVALYLVRRSSPSRPACQTSPVRTSMAVSQPPP